MIIKIICEKCNKEFVGSDNKKKCVEHELIEHYNANVVFKTNLAECLFQLDNIYNTNTTYSFKEISINEDYNGEIENISYCFEIINNQFKKDVQIYIYEYQCIPSISDIRSEIEKYFKSFVKKHYEGIVSYEDFLGGYGADDYILDG